MGVTACVQCVIRAVKAYFSTASFESVYEARDGQFVAGDRPRRKDHAILWGDTNERVLVARQATECGQRLALAPRQERQHLVRRQVGERLLLQKRWHPGEHAQFPRHVSLPVSGSLSGCFGFGLQSSCANPNTLSGTLDGTSISLSSNGAGTVTTDQPPPGYTHYFVDFDDGSTLQLQSDPALDGVLLLSDQSSDPGAVYCMDSVTVSTQGNDKTITVDKVSRAGAMPGNAVAGAIDMTFCLTP